MKIKDCIKGFNQGISKVIPPEQTCKVVLRKIKNLNPSILNRYFEVQNPNKIPQYRFIGTDYYQQIVQSQGTNGKGHSDEQALASGIMELVERYSCDKYLRNRNVVRISSFKDFKNNLFQLDHLYSNFIDESRVRILKDKELKFARIRWHEGRSLNGRKVYLPMSLIGYLLEGTNGMSAGNSLEEALLHAICEVIERHCLTLIEINKLETPLIDLSSVNSPIARQLLNKFRSFKKQIFIKDFSLGIGLPVIGVVRKIDKNNCVITAGVATTGEEALIRALTENSQAEGKGGPIRNCLAKHHFVNNRVMSVKDIADIDNNNMRSELKNIEEILNKQNMKIFFLDATDKTLNIPSVIVYIAGAKYFDKKIVHRNILMGLIEECLGTENYSDAERYLNKADKIDKKNRLLYFYYRGLILKRRSQYRKAAQNFLKATKIELTELQKLSLANLGLCYQAMNDMDKAIDCLIKAIDLFPGFSLEYLKFYYDNIPLLSNDRNLFNNAIILYREIRILRRYFPRTGLGKFKDIFYKYQKNKKTISAHLERTQTRFVSGQYKEGNELKKAEKKPQEILTMV